MSQRKHSPDLYWLMSSGYGLSNREIARRLGVNESTVRRNLNLEKRRADDRAHLLTEKGRARTRKFRLRETLSRMTNRLKEKP